MKTLDQIIKDFETNTVNGEGDIFDGDGHFASDFDTLYDKDLFSQFEQMGEYGIDFGQNYTPKSFMITQSRMHDLSSQIQTEQERLKSLLVHDPRWVYYNYKQNIQQVNKNLYTIEIDRAKGIGGVVPDLVRVVEFHVTDDDTLERLDFIVKAITPNKTKVLATHKVSFVY